MHIVYFLDVFPSISETFVLNEVEEMERLGVRVSVYSLSRSKISVPHSLAYKWEKRTHYIDLNRISIADKFLDHLNLFLRAPLRHIDALRWSSHFDSDFAWHLRSLVEVARQCLADNADHLHAHFANQAAEFAWCVSRLSGIPFSITTHRYDILDTPYRYYPSLSVDAAFVRTISQYNKRKLELLGVIPSKITVIHCGVRCKDFSPANEEKKIDILSIGSLIPRKGHRVLLEAIALLREQFSDIKVVIIGEGSERNNLEQLIVEKKLHNHISLTGAKSQSDIKMLLDQSKVFVLPSFSEGISVAAMESMAMEVPVVCSNVDGMDELVHDGRNGFLVEPGSIVDLTKKISWLFQDPSLRFSLGKHGRDTVLKFFNHTKECSKLLQSISVST